KEIKTLISDSVEQVEAGRKLVNEAGEAMDDIVTSVQLVADIMTGSAAASQQQSAGIEQVNQAVGQLDEITQQNAALVEEAAAASESMQAQAIKLTQLVESFTLTQAGRTASRSDRKPATAMPPRAKTHTASFGTASRPKMLGIVGSARR
ncbi:MAG: methyl-accepting chemotaxis protein, partial [Thiobacillus sp.]